MKPEPSNDYLYLIALRLHLIAILGVIHFWMLVKSDVFYPALFGLVLAFLLGYRIYANYAAPKLHKAKIQDA